MEDYKKKYEEIIENIKEAKERMGGYTFSSVVDKIIPELKESEDEKIRKELLKIAKESEDSFYMVMTPRKKESLISWLEKQGKNEEINEASYRVGIKRVLDNPESYGLEKQGERTIPKNIDDAALQYVDTCAVDGEVTHDNITEPYWNNHSMMNAYKAGWLEKKGEQNSSNKVKPKFHEGDKLVSTKNPRLTYEILEVGHINELGNSEYKVEIFTDGKAENPRNIHYMECYKVDKWAKLIEQKPIDKVEPSFHAGDFITDGERIFQIKETIWERNNRNDGTTYCESLIVNLRDGITYANNTDLKKYHLWTIKDAKDGDIENTNDHAFWSEEDELHIRELESLVKQEWAIAERENDKDKIHKMSDLSFFLKTLKPQLKQEWSEEDEEMRIYACKFLDDAKQIDYSVPHKEDIDKCISWLKSLKERYTWRPSDEQMELIKDIVFKDRQKITRKELAIFHSIYNDLKKLKS